MGLHFKDNPERLQQVNDAILAAAENFLSGEVKGEIAKRGMFAMVEFGLEAGKFVSMSMIRIALTAVAPDEVRRIDDMLLLDADLEACEGCDKIGGCEEYNRALALQGGSTTRTEAEEDEEPKTEIPAYILEAFKGPFN